MQNTDTKSWKNEAVNFEFVDCIRYNSGYLLILMVQAKGTSWFIPLIAERTRVDAIMRGQKLLDKI